METVKKIPIRIVYVCKVDGKIYASGDSMDEVLDLGLDAYKEKHGHYPDSKSVCAYPWW